MEEPLEIAEEQRTYVDEMFARLRELDHYAALGLGRSADRKAIKRAYLHLVGVIHPDRYFGKRLGPYKARLEAVFARVTLAYETLHDRDARAAYDLSLPGPVVLPEPRSSGSMRAAPEAQGQPSSPAVPVVDPATAARRKEAMAALQARFAGARDKVKVIVASADRARAAGDLAAALDGYRQALVYAPSDATLRAAHDEVQRLLDEKAAASQAAKAWLSSRLGRPGG